MKKILIISAIAAMATSASAQDRSYNGFFIGAQTGWQQDQAKVASDSVNQDVSADAFVYGAQVGYDWNLGGFVVGLEAMLAGSTGSGTATSTVGDTYKLKARTTWGFSGRVGYVVSDPLLLYGRLGYTGVDYSYTLNNAYQERYDRSGVLVGLGAEYQFTRNISARVEWNYADLGKDTFQRPAQPPTVFLPTELRFERMGVLFGLNYRF